MRTHADFLSIFTAAWKDRRLFFHREEEREEKSVLAVALYDRVKVANEDVNIRMGSSRKNSSSRETRGHAVLASRISTSRCASHGDDDVVGVAVAMKSMLTELKCCNFDPICVEDKISWLTDFSVLARWVSNSCLHSGGRK